MRLLDTFSHSVPLREGGGRTRLPRCFWGRTAPVRHGPALLPRTDSPCVSLRRSPDLLPRASAFYHTDERPMATAPTVSHSHSMHMPKINHPSHCPFY